jgi:hypothetical protein
MTVQCSESRIRYVDRQRYTGLRTEPIADGKNKKGSGPTPMEENLSIVKKSVIPRIGKAKKMFGIHRKRFIKCMFLAVLSGE